MGFIGAALVLPVLCILMSCAAEGSGRWAKCSVKPSSDAFKDPQKNTPAWYKATTGNPQFTIDVGRSPGNYCNASFPFMGKEMILYSNEFYYLKKLKGGLKENGQDYTWVDYKDFHYNNKPCIPVKYEEESTDLICWLKQAKMEECEDGEKSTDILGSCSQTRGIATATYCKKVFHFDSSFTMSNARVLCLHKVAMREMEIISTDIVQASGYQKPEMMLEEQITNGASKEKQWQFGKMFTRETLSEYSTERGWRLKVPTIFKSSLLSDAIAQWEATVEAEGHGTYTTIPQKKKAEKMTYKREFSVPAKTKFMVSVKIFNRKLQIPFKAKEKYYDEKGNLIGSATVGGNWKGLFTFTGKTDVKESKIEI